MNSSLALKTTFQETTLPHLSLTQRGHTAIVAREWLGGGPSLPQLGRLSRITWRECQASGGTGHGIATLPCCIDLLEVKSAAGAAHRPATALAGGAGAPSSGSPGG